MRERKLSFSEFKVLNFLYKYSSFFKQYTAKYIGKCLHLQDNTVIARIFYIGKKTGVEPSREDLKLHKNIKIKQYYLSWLQKKQLKTIIINGGYY